MNTQRFRIALSLAILLGSIASNASADARDERAAAILRQGGATVRLDSSGRVVAVMLFPEVSRLTDADLACIDGLAALKTVLLIETHLTDASLAQLATLPALETLYLGGTQTDREGVTRVGGLNFTNAGLKHLAKLKSLRTLVLASAGFGDAGIDSINGLTDLRSLGLSSPGFTDASLPKLVGLTALQSLNLSDSRIKGPGLASLAVLPRLSYLVLGPNDFDAVELQHLGGLASLRSLMFYKSTLSAEVPDLLERLQRLETLELVETPLPAPRLAALKKAMPTTSINYEPKEQVHGLLRPKK
jgi:hypothetical protein